MAPCGNVLRVTKTTDFDNGDHGILELTYPDGTSKELVRGREINPCPYYTDPFHCGIGNYKYQPGDRYSSDIFKVDYGTLDGTSAEILIDMKTGEIHDASEYVAGSDFSKDEKVTDKYQAGYSGNLYEIDNPDNIVADLSGGNGPRRVFHSEITDQYWVISNSGYYYALDSNFKRIHEPVQLTKDAYDLCPFGIILYEEDGSMGLYDAEGKQITAFPEADVKGFMADNINIITGEQLYLDLT